LGIPKPRQTDMAKIKMLKTPRPRPFVTYKFSTTHTKTKFFPHTNTYSPYTNACDGAFPSYICGSTLGLRPSEKFTQRR
jgi:hypothetical protein